MSVPAFGDLRRRALMTIVLICTLAGTLILALHLNVHGLPAWPPAAIAGLTLVFYLAAPLVARRTGSLRRAALMLVIAKHIGTTAFVAMTGGLASPFAPLMVLGPLTTVYLLGTRATMVSLAATAAAIAAMAFAGAAGLVGARYLVTGSIGIWAEGLALTILIAAIAGLAGTHIRMQRRMMAELEASAARLDAAHRERLSLFAGASHEIRTPLNGIIGASLLLQNAGLSPEQHRYAEAMATSAKALLHIVNDVLDASRIEAAAIELDRAPFDPRETLGEAIAIVSGLAAEKGLALRLESDPDAPAEVVGDLFRLRQIVVNFLGNAVKFTPSGGIIVRYGRGTQGMVRIAVTDTGPGIRPADLEHVFERFRQVGDAADRAKGTGLGLYVARQLAGLMGGRVGAESAPGQGATFWVELPIGAEAALEAA
ncbi:MAG TPA: ATP-binding protein [Paracoccaceae bacterium]|nr:ATP-binding protein [Paracoccaceae bacterium]